jgi:hypothetical protein
MHRIYILTHTHTHTHTHTKRTVCVCMLYVKYTYTQKQKNEYGKIFFLHKTASSIYSPLLLCGYAYTNICTMCVCVCVRVCVCVCMCVCVCVCVYPHTQTYSTSNGGEGKKKYLRKGAKRRMKKGAATRILSSFSDWKKWSTCGCVLLGYKGLPKLRGVCVFALVFALAVWPAACCLCSAQHVSS